MTVAEPSPKKPSDLFSRLITAIILIPLIYLMFKGGWPALAIVLVAGAIMAGEIASIIKFPMGSLSFGAVVSAVTGPAVLAIFLPITIAQYALFIIAAALLVLVLICPSWIARFMAISLSLCLFSIVMILGMDGGTQWIVFAVVVIIAADSMAYFGGRMIGGPKLAEKISPSKTWSGAVCGVSAGALTGSLMGMVLGFDPIITGVLALFVADLSIGGDLMESWFKRCFNVKDSGRILPGHGGFLDRFDGYLLALPFLYIVLSIGVV